MSESNGRLLSDFKVAELKAELEKRGLPTQGIKVGLVERMSKWMIDNGLNPATHLFEGSNSAPCSQSKTTAPSTSEVPTPLTSPSIKEELKEEKEVPSITTVKEKEEDKTTEGEEAKLVKEEKKETAKDEQEKKEDDKQPEVNDAAKEKEMAGRSIWLKNLKSGTKAMEIKAMCMPIGHVMRAKLFTVKGKESIGMTALGYVTFATVNEADTAVLRLDKTQLKGVTVDVTKASPHNLPFLKSKKKETASAASTTNTETGNGTNKEEKKVEEKKKEKEEEKPKEPIVKKEEIAPAEIVKQQSIREDYSQRPSIPPRFPVRTPAGNTNGGRSSNDRRSSDKKDDREKNELAKRLAEKEREHRKREEELKLQKEKERIRYEKEKVEKEKLKLQLDKLKAEMARGGGGRGEKRDDRGGRDEREKEKERIKEREKEKERERDRDRKRERASYIAPAAAPQRLSRETYSSTRPTERMRDDRERKRDAYHPSRDSPSINYNRDTNYKRRRPSPSRRDNRDIRTLSSSAFLPQSQGPSRVAYPSHMSGGGGWMGQSNQNNYNTATTAMNPWASATLSQYPQYQRRY